MIATTDIATTHLTATGGAALDAPSGRRGGPSSGRRPGLGVLLLVALLLCSSSGWAEETEAPPVYPTGNARLVVQGQIATGVSFSIAPGGPQFSLGPIARALGVELRVGPLGGNNTLVFENARITVGPDLAAMVVVGQDAAEREDIVSFRHRPLAAPDGLRVPLDFLDMSFGEQLGVQFQWQADALRLEVMRRQLEEIEARVNLIHQYGLSTLEIQLSKAPRYRVEHLPGAVEIRLLEDRLRLPVSLPRGADPLVRNIVALPDRLRIELVDNAQAAEPRLLTQPLVRLVVEVFEGAASRGGTTADGTQPDRSTSDDDTTGIRTIVIDPGHGGIETGAIGRSGSMEKDLTLQVARRLRRELERRMPVKVVLTRDSDIDVHWDTRTAIANQNKADLFISLHFNSSFGRTAKGAETFFLSREASDQMAADAAAMENQGVQTPPDDPELDLKMILWDLAQSFHLAESQRFASLVQEELNLALGMRDRGVKQAPFRVLMGANMPAVLVELGFLSNPEEERKAQSLTHQADLVDALVRATQRFKSQMEARGGTFSGDSSRPEEGGR